MWDMCNVLDMCEICWVGYVWNGYVWDMCNVLDMCGICVVDTFGMDYNLLNGYALQEYVLVGYVWVGYVWNGYVWDMCR